MTDDDPGVAAWKVHTTAFDRVQSVASTVSQPTPVSDIAEDAQVAENTARDHLERLVDLNVLLKHDENGTTHYSPDPLHTRLQTLRELLDAHDRDDLIQLKADLQSQIEAWCAEYDAVSPADLREQAADTATAAQTRDRRQTAHQWELTDYRRSIVEDAIENYATYTDQPSP